MGSINLAAIDIGSNGARLLIKKFDSQTDDVKSISKLMFVRIPLRLGKDVFTLGKISKEREEMMVHMMKGFKQFMKLHKVNYYRACATSAMRDAENGKKIIKKIEDESGIKLEIIRGEEEAKLLFNNILEAIGDKAGNYAYVDVGGGSTEISLIHNGTLAESHSYNIGTLRLLSGKVTATTNNQLETDLMDFSSKYNDIKIIGSGGNINRYFKMAANKSKDKSMKIEELSRLYEMLKPLSIEERMISYNLKEDRADVIIPAGEIFLKIADLLKCNTIIVPNISLADSIVDGLYIDKEESK